MKIGKLLGISSILLGAVLLVGTGFALAQADPQQGGRPLNATLTGEEEIPPGDPEGTGTANFTLNLGQNEVCYEISVADIDLPATAAHIHDGAAGEVGPPVVTLEAPGADGMASGCETATKELIQAILQDPAGFYINVHNAAFPDGAVRGQLSK